MFAKRIVKDPVTGFEYRLLTDSEFPSHKMYFSCESWTTDDKHILFFRSGETGEQLIRLNGETGEETVTSIPRLYTLKTRAALKELSLFNLEGNFDRHDALVMLMLLREDKLRFMFDKDGNKATQNSN